MKPLFNGGDLSVELQPQIEQMRQSIASAARDDFPAREQWLEVYGAVPVDLDEGNIKTTRPGEGLVTFIVPFFGTAELMKYRPAGSSGPNPEAELGIEDIRFTYELAEAQEADELKDRFENDLDVLVKWLGWCKEEVDRFNLDLEAVLDAALAEIQGEADADDALMKDLGFPEI